MSRYDILALEPTSERAFTSACNNKRVDIVTLPLGVRMPFRMRPPALKAAAANGAALEVSYNAALTDAAARRNFFANATAVVRAVGSGVGGGGRCKRRSFTFSTQLDAARMSDVSLGFTRFVSRCMR